MHRENNLNRVLNPVLLLILPAFYLLAGIYFRFLLGDLSMRSMDPDYIYFASGFGLSTGHFMLGHIDNPGSPLQVLLAMLFRLIYLIRMPATGFYEDVLTHSDLYLSVSNIVITILVSVGIWLTGRLITRYSNSILAGLLLQSAPFLAAIWYDLIGRITPELLLPLPVFLLTILIIRKYYSESTTFSLKETVVLGLIVAFGCSIKLTFLPLCLIPLIVVSGWRNKLVILGSSVVSFFIIAFPVTIQAGRFWHWIRDLFIHSGNYGSGQANIIDLTTFRANCITLYHEEKLLIFTVALVVIGLLVYLFRPLKQKNRFLLLVGFGLVIAITVQFLMVGKHFAHRYFIPAMLLNPFLIFVISEIIKKLTSFRYSSYFGNAIIIVYLLLAAHAQYKSIPLKSEVMGAQVKAREATREFATSLDRTVPLIIVSQDYGCPFPEYALMFSSAWSGGDMKPIYAKVLSKVYPNTYQYATWDDKIKYWGNDLSFYEGQQLMIYLENDTPELLERTMKKFFDGKDYQEGKLDTLFLNPVNHEVIYSTKIRALIQP